MGLALSHSLHRRDFITDGDILHIMYCCKVRRERKLCSGILKILKMNTAFERIPSRHLPTLFWNRNEGETTVMEESYDARQQICREINLKGGKFYKICLLFPFLCTTSCAIICASVCMTSCNMHAARLSCRLKRDCLLFVISTCNRTHRRRLEGGKNVGVEICRNFSAKQQHINNIHAALRHPPR